MKNASLVVVGVGIKFKSHLTVEAEAYIKESDVVFYLVNEPAMKEWIQITNPNAESLDKFYAKHSYRLHCYRAMTEHVIHALRKNQHVCFALYGHPTILAKPGLDAVLQAKTEGYYTKILPGISAEDCLLADLLVNPGSSGCQSYEATDFLIYRRRIDSSNHIILWQVGIIGALGYPKSHDNTLGAHVLTETLKSYYDSDHPVTLYQAAQYPHFEPLIHTIPLKNLASAKFPSMTTLYIPPAYTLKCDQAMLKALNMHISN
ncbi:MAG: uroporphyrinogen III methylase [Gammaproteobacteria bacterium]|nr:uroporphyrinogen III methylase [Gammaproteobacteria bacterium]